MSEPTSGSAAEGDGAGEPGEAAPEPISLGDNEAELVTAEIDALLPALDGDRRAHFDRLRTAVTEGVVPAELVGTLGSVVELALQTARARQLYKAEGEKVLTALLRRTPRGKELDQQIADVNTALGALAGQELDRVQVRMRTLGHFTITIGTDATTLTLAVRPDQVAVDSVAVGEPGGY